MSGDRRKKVLMRVCQLSWILLLGVLSVGCSGVGVKQPTATFNRMNLGEVTPQGFTMNFDVALENPNAVALPLSAADYKLSLGGAKVLEGKAKPSGTLPANGSLPITLPVMVTFENLLAAENALGKGDLNLPYSFEGGLDVGGPKLLGQGARVPLKYE